MNVLDVSPALNVTPVGHPRDSPRATAPPWPVAVIGTVTLRSGSALSCTVTVTEAPSSTL